MLIRPRPLLLMAFGCGLAACILLLSSCRGASSPTTMSSSGATPAATVAYRPPIIVHLTPSVTRVPKPTATATA